MDGPKQFTIPIAAVPAARPRVARAGWSYYPAKYSRFKKELHAAFQQAAKDVMPLTVVFALGLMVTLRRPKTSKLECPKPDVDNYAKAIMDAGNETLWKDDSQCYRLEVEKQWGDEDKIEVNIYPRQYM